MSRPPTVIEAPDTVIVIDDDPGVREALKDLLKSVGLRVQLYASAPEFLKDGRPDAPTCLVLDVRLPGQGGLDFQRELNGAGIHIPIVFITGHADIPMTVQAMKGGAIEFITKPFRARDLLDAVLSGLKQDRAWRENEQAVSRLRARFDSLSPRERDVLAFVASGRLNKQIAGDIGLSEIMVKIHRRNLMRKMEAKSLAELVLMAQRLGIRGAGS